jgi:nitroreductase
MASSNKAAVFRAIAQSRRSSRRFEANRLIPNGILRDILESTIKSPSSFNLQPTQIILVQSKSIKDQLSKEAMLGPGNQYRTRDSSVLAVFLSDLEVGKRINRIYELEKGHRHPNYLSSMPMASSFLIGEGHAATFIKGIATDLLSEVQPMPSIEPVQAWSYKNAALVAQTYVYAAESNDLATSIMEGYDARRVKEILRIPDRYAIPMMVSSVHVGALTTLLYCLSSLDFCLTLMRPLAFLSAVIN